MGKQKYKIEYERDEHIKKAVKFLKKNNYTFVKRLGSGSFGDVIAIGKKDSEAIAAKIIHKAYTSPGEIYLWPCLRHPNVLPVLERMHYKYLDIFLMPLMNDCLCNVLKHPDFRNNNKLFEITIGWLKDMFTGLEYMHDYGVCHNDIKEDNILISPDLRAVISDFTGVAETKEPVKRCILPKDYSPPETWIREEQELHVDGEKVDIWAAGLVIFYCFSDRWVEKKRERMSLTSKIFFETKKWICDIYPSIYKCLQENFFSSLIKKAHPACEITKEDCVMALNLLQGILRYSPETRPSATKVLDHSLFSRKLRSSNMLQSDEIWIIKQSDAYQPKSHNKKTEISQVSATESFKISDRVDEVIELVPDIRSIDAGKENTKCDERHQVAGSLRIQKDMCDVQSSEGSTAVSNGNICKRIRNAFNNLRKFSERKNIILHKTFLEIDHYMELESNRTSQINILGRQ